MSEAKQTAKLALEALEDKKAMDVRILDITHVSRRIKNHFSFLKLCLGSY